MSILRYDLTSNDWVIFAPSRARRPHELKNPAGLAASSLAADSSCPFCPGNETMTPPEIYALRGNTAPNTPGWGIRVISNKFPALRVTTNDWKTGRCSTIWAAAGLTR
jgi:galactose-1-phosphate uridylyltransferase